MKRLVAVLVVAAAAYGLYSSTLLPGQDLGDTADFQVVVAVPALLTARDAYPLYYFLARPTAAGAPANPAALNRLSARTAALAVGALAWVAAEVRRDILPIDRGLSLATVDRDGRQGQVFYRGGILEPQERFLIRP